MGQAEKLHGTVLSPINAAVLATTSEGEQTAAAKKIEGLEAQAVRDEEEIDQLKNELTAAQTKILRVQAATQG